LQRRHSYVKVRGVEPVHVPLLAKRTEPLVSVPEIEGRNVFTGAVPASTAVGSETAVVVPKLFVAVTATRSREPMSIEAGVYVLAVAPAMSLQFAPPVSQRRHWWRKVIVGEPVQSPVVALYDVTVPSSERFSTIAGSDVFSGRVLATSGVGFDSFVADPRLFVAVTSTRSVEPISAGVGT
jgi:hypothetical protein